MLNMTNCVKCIALCDAGNKVISELSLMCYMLLVSASVFWLFVWFVLSNLTWLFVLWQAGSRLHLMSVLSYFPRFKAVQLWN